MKLIENNDLHNQAYIKIKYFYNNFLLTKIYYFFYFTSHRIYEIFMQLYY